jgi:hypothetical protein
MVKVSMASPSRKKKRRSRYSKGELNRLIDDLIHPLSDQRPELTILDAALHGLVQQNPPENAVKFIRYNLHKIIEEIARSTRL